MKVLVVKLTSMGDLLHLMPALSDLKSNYQDLQVDWMVEDSFSEVPGWHPAVCRTIPVSTRRWRRPHWRVIGEFFAFVRDARTEHYDFIIDAQGLLKSAAFSRIARARRRGCRIGFSAISIKEKIAARFYNIKVDVPSGQHAIDRLRQLFAGGFGYPTPTTPLDYALQVPGLRRADSGRRTVLLLHGTTWNSKHLPEQHWVDISGLAVQDGFEVKLCWGNEHERQRAQRIAERCQGVTVLPQLSLTQIAAELQSSAGVIAVDTGLGHLAAALGIPTVSVYGASDAKLTGTVGNNQLHLQTQYPCSPCLIRNCDKLAPDNQGPPCYNTFSAMDIWKNLTAQIV